MTSYVAVSHDGHVAEAIGTVRTERCRAASERAAFEAFARSAGELSPQRPQPPRFGSRGDELLVRSSVPDRGIKEVNSQYRETVMSVSHYEDDYGDTRSESMRVEFGDALADALEQSETLTPQLKRAIVEGALTAAESRRSYVETLERELDTLHAARETFKETADVVTTCDATPWRQRSFEELVAAYERVDTHERDCERVLADRQRTRSTGWRGYDLDELHEYLYAGSATTYPVLNDGITLLVATRETKRVLVRELVRRV